MEEQVGRRIVSLVYPVRVEVTFKVFQLHELSSFGSFRATAKTSQI